MWSVCNESDGTAYDVFSNYGVTVAGKTGTAENSGTDHTVFMCYAPYEKPEVAIAVVVEHGSMKNIQQMLQKHFLINISITKTILQVKSDFGKIIDYNDLFVIL